MALSALCDDSDWGRTWRDLLQHRFSSSGDLDQHAVGNLLIVALWELLGDTVEGLDWVGRLLGARGRVLPMAAVPLRIEADVVDAAGATRARSSGRAPSPSTTGTIVAGPPGAVRPAGVPGGGRRRSRPPTGSCSVRAPGTRRCSRTCSSPGCAEALHRTSARTIVTLNLASGESGETAGMRADQYLEVLHAHAPGAAGRRRRRGPDGRRGRRRARRAERGPGRPSPAAPGQPRRRHAAARPAAARRRPTRTCSTAFSATSARARTHPSR